MQTALFFMILTGIQQWTSRLRIDATELDKQKLFIFTDWFAKTQSKKIYSRNLCKKESLEDWLLKVISIKNSFRKLVSEIFSVLTKKVWGQVILAILFSQGESIYFRMKILFFMVKENFKKMKFILFKIKMMKLSLQVRYFRMMNRMEIRINLKIKTM